MYYEDYRVYHEQNNALLSYLRFVQFEGDPSDLCPHMIPPVASIALCTPTKRDLRLPVLSAKNETRMLQKLREIALKRLHGFKETVEDDEELLRKRGKTMEYNERNCIVYRMGEKKVSFRRVYNIVA